jgi:purine-binding chemotaxis protein CheW
MQKFTVFSISDEVFGIPIERVVQIIRVQKVFSVPGLPSFLSGVMSVRGSVIPLIDLRRRFGTKPSGGKERIILSRFGKEKIGFLVDEIKDIVAFDRQDVVNPPSVFKGFKTEYLLGLGKQGGAIVILLNIDNLLTSEEKIILEKSMETIEDEVAEIDETTERR